jgi:hypothetical protein
MRMSNSNLNELDYYGRRRKDAEEIKLQSESDLETAYGTKKTALENSRVKQRQEAAINNELLMKYLPQLNKANGLAGLGVSESANIDALSRYQTNLGNIEETHRQGMSDLDTWKSGKESEILSAYRSDLAQIDAEERKELLAEEDRLRTEAKEKEDRIRENALMYIETNLFETEEELNAFVDGLAVSDETKAEIKSLGMAQVKKIEDQTELEKGKLGADTDAAGNEIVAAYSKGDANNKFDFVGDANARVNLDTAGATFFVSVGDKDIPVSSGGLVPSETIPETVRSYAENDKVFTYDGGIYIKKNNSIYQVAPAGDGNDPEYNRAYNELKSYLNGGTAPTVDASPAATTKPYARVDVGTDENGNMKGDATTPQGKAQSVTLVPYVSTMALNAALDEVEDGTPVHMYDKWYIKKDGKVYEIQE